MACIYQHKCFLCIRAIKTNYDSFIKNVLTFERKYSSAISKQGSVTKSGLINLNSPIHSKFSMFRRLLPTKETSNLLHPYTNNMNIEQTYSTLYHTTLLIHSYKRKTYYHRSGAKYSNKDMSARFLNLTYAYISVLPTHKNKVSLVHKYITNMGFTSSTTTNIEKSDSSTTSNIFKKLYRKIIPEPLSVSKATLYRTGAILSSCCTHEVSLWSQCL